MVPHEIENLGNSQTDLPLIAKNGEHVILIKAAIKVGKGPKRVGET